MEKRLYRSRTDRMLGGVCGGIAEYFGVDPTLIRLLAVVLIVAGGAAIIAYIIAWIVIPEEPKNLSIEEKAEKENVTIPGEKSEERRKDVELVAWILIFVGLIWFCLNLFSLWLPSRFFVRLVFPVALVIVGILLLWERKKEER
ncbi:MAG: PspC domain-containing protein [Atribacterales bacterium]